MFTNILIALLSIGCGDGKSDTAETDTAVTETDTGEEQADTGEEQADTGEEQADTGEEEETDTGEEETDTGEEEETDTGEEEETDTGEEQADTGEEADPLADATCDAAFAGCTEQDFIDGDMTSNTGVIAINMIGMQPYSPKCLTVTVGQTVSIGATGGHPFRKECAEDSVMDSQDGNTSDVEFTFTTPGYYNYRCAVNAHATMVGNIKVLPQRSLK